MKKYGIFSLNIYEKDNNWGSILQSYALQQAIKNLGYSPYVIDIIPSYINAKEARYPIVRNRITNIKRFIRFFYNDVINFRKYINRDNKFKAFIAKYYNCSKKYKKIEEIKEDEFDGFVVGSDIIWDTAFTNGFNELYFCDNEIFYNKNNIAYAPSMNDGRFNIESEKIFKRLLNNFNYLSVRECSNEKYVKSFTDKNVETVLDPTLLLTQQDYSGFLLDSLVKEPYILVYTVPSDELLSEYVYKYAKEKGLKLVRIECLDFRIKRYNCINYNDAGIEEWLTLIKNAEMIVTNSFHACIFSIIFKKQFHAVYRDPGKKKIEDLMNSLGIENYSEKSKNYSFDLEKKIDYEDVYTCLSKLQNKSLSYLLKALNGK